MDFCEAIASSQTLKLKFGLKQGLGLSVSSQI